MPAYIRETTVAIDVQTSSVVALTACPPAQIQKLNTAVPTNFRELFNNSSEHEAPNGMII
jgi:hypothetical protein